MLEIWGLYGHKYHVCVWHNRTHDTHPKSINQKNYIKFQNDRNQIVYHQKMLFNFGAFLLLFQI